MATVHQQNLLTCLLNDSFSESVPPHLAYDCQLKASSDAIFVVEEPRLLSGVEVV